VRTVGDRGAVVVEVEDVALPADGSRAVLVRIFRPPDAEGILPVVLYVAERLRADDSQARTLAVEARAAVVVPERDFSGEAESGYEVLRWIASQGARRRLDGSRIAVVGDGRADELVRLACDRGGPALCAVDALTRTGP
jgi:acetyl esterase/lipase